MHKNVDLITYTTPESVGVKSENIERYIKRLEEKGLATHSMILAKGNEVFFEHYWEPFTADFQHRMYSVSKSFVALAIGFLEQDGLLDLDDPISKYFAEELKNQPDQNMHRQTIRHMLMMSTAKPPQDWFRAQSDDRVKFYFSNDDRESRPSGTIFQYDSTGSFVLCALVERITGKLFMEYLREKLFDEIGVSKEAYCLKCPGGHSWGDSAVLCTPMDLFRVARFVLNGGSWNGKQLLNERFVREATSKLIDNDFKGFASRSNFGYGYLFWRTHHDSFYLNGMGSQYAICVPEKDMIMVYNADNQGKDPLLESIFDVFFDLIVGESENRALPENKDALDSLKSYTDGLKLLAQTGEKRCDFEQEINGVIYRFDENPMGITEMQFMFEGEKGTLKYTNVQGDKELIFGRGENFFGRFPEEGYSQEIGAVYEPGSFYRCAASAAWVGAQTLRIMVQIVDRYFGNMTMTFGFQGDEVGVYMQKTAEFFLEEYQGFGHGRRV